MAAAQTSAATAALGATLFRQYATDAHTEWATPLARHYGCEQDTGSGSGSGSGSGRGLGLGHLRPVEEEPQRGVAQAVVHLQRAMLVEQRHQRWPHARSVMASAMLLRARQHTLDTAMRRVLPKASKTSLCCTHCFSSVAPTCAANVLADVGTNKRTEVLFRRHGWAGVGLLVEAVAYGQWLQHEKEEQAQRAELERFMHTAAPTASTGLAIPASGAGGGYRTNVAHERRHALGAVASHTTTAKRPRHTSASVAAHTTPFGAITARGGVGFLHVTTPLGAGTASVRPKKKRRKKKAKTGGALRNTHTGAGQGWGWA